MNHECQKSGNNQLPRISPPSHHHLPGEQSESSVVSVQCTTGCGRLEAEELEAMTGVGMSEEALPPPLEEIEPTAKKESSEARTKRKKK